MTQDSHLKDASLPAWCRLVRDRRWSTRQKIKLINHFGTPDKIFAAPPARVLACCSRVPKTRSAGVHDKEVQRDSDWLACPNHHFIEYTSRRYPAKLKEIHDPPLGLFAIGDLSLLDDPSIALVGARRPTPIGLKMAESISTQLAQLGLVVTSGMALGIDGAAHQGALRCDGASIAVLAGGLDQIYPVRHRKLYHQLAEQGLILSEYPLGFRANKATFPQRNRIVSGVSLGVVIVEAAQRSGTLITARLAMEQGREVMVVPGPAISASYQGSHGLIQQGAALVQDAADVVDCLSSELSLSLSELTIFNENENRPTAARLDTDLQAVLRLVGATSTSVDQIIFASGLTAAKVSSMLVTLELEGAVAVAADGGYVNLG